jgi:hypothetical protein
MPLPKNKKNDQYERLDRRQKVAALYLQGKTQWDIARLVNVSQGTVSNDLAAIREDWLASALRDFDSKKAEELAKLDRLEAEAWEAWQRSKEDAETVRKKSEQVRTSEGRGKNQRSTLVPVKVVMELTKKGQAGDPRFLEQVRWCVETRLKLMGLMRNQADVKPVATLDWGAVMQTAGIGPEPVQDTIKVQVEQHIERRRAQQAALAGQEASREGEVLPNLITEVQPTNRVENIPSGNGAVHA